MLEHRFVKQQFRQHLAVRKFPLAHVRLVDGDELDESGEMSAAPREGLSVDIRTIAAEASWECLQLRSVHPVYETTTDGFKIVKWCRGAPSPKNFIVDSMVCKDEDLFWKLNRAYDCHGISTVFLCVCECLSRQGFNLVFDGASVTNFYAVNGLMDPASVCEVKISVDDPETNRVFKMDLLSTLAQRMHLASASLSVLKMFDDPEHKISKAEIENAIKNGIYLGIPVNKNVMHWWSCFELENQNMVHFDLCGPAYGLYDYKRTVDGKHSPVFTVVTGQVQLQPHTNPNYAHKFTMTHLGKKDRHRVVRFPAEYPPFSLQEKISLEATPVEVMRERIGCPEALQEQLAAALVQHVISEALTRQQGPLCFKLHGIAKRPSLNGCQVRAICVDTGRVGVELESGEKIKVLPGKLTMANARSQLLTLEEMNRVIKEEEQRSVDQYLKPGDFVCFEGLERSGYLNGCQGVVVEEVPHTDSGSGFQYVVQVQSTGEKKRVKRQNLKLQREKVDSQAETDHKEAILQYLTRDPIGMEFFRRVWHARSFGISNLTDPELLPAFEKMVEMKAAATLLNSPPAQRQWEETLRLSNKPRFQEFRTKVLQPMRSGMSSQELLEIFQSNPEFAVFYDECKSSGLLLRRSQ